jgi:GDPmannose 4,6-dehydratase
MWRMLQQDAPRDFVLATGETRSVRDFARMAFARLGLALEFKGQGKDEIGIVAAVDHARMDELDISAAVSAGSEVLAVDARYFRPTEVDFLVGDAARARELLGWQPRHDLQSLVNEMVDRDLALTRREKYLQEGGFETFNGFE